MSNKAELAELSARLKAVVHELYGLELMASDFPADGESLHGKMFVLKNLVTAFASLDESSTTLSVPQDVLEYIEAGRNPNVYTRQFSEAVTKESQGMHGKMLAHADFASLLGNAVTEQFPQLSKEVDLAKQETVESENSS